MILKKTIGKSMEFSNRNGYLILKTSKEELDLLNDRYGLNYSPATYIVFGDSNEATIKNINFYVGESSVNVISRLKESIQKRPWIKEIFIIMSPQGNLGMEIVKSLEFMIFQTLKNCLTETPENVLIKPDNAINGVIGYRAMLSDNDYTQLIQDAFAMFFSDVFLYSKYKTYFNDFDINVNLNTNGKICIDKKTNELFSSFILDDSIIITKNSRISIEFSTLGNAKERVKGLFSYLLTNKLLYPTVFNNKIQWLFTNDVTLSRSNIDEIIVLFSNSLNATLANSVIDYNTFIKRSRK